MSILGFLGCSLHRICMKIVGSIRPIHIQWAEFSDRCSEIGVTLKSALKTYWSEFQTMFPALHESLTFNFEARPITSTTVEQTFTLTSTQVRANNCPSTSAKNMQHATNVKGSIMRDMTDYIASQTNNKRTRLVRSSKSRADYLTRAAAFGKHIYSMT